MATVTYTTPGDDTFTVPEWVSSITVTIWGGGADGQTVLAGTDVSGGVGGGAGAKSVKFYASVTPGHVYDLHVPNTAQDGWFDSLSTQLAKAANGQAGGLAADSIGDTVTSGEDGLSGNTIEDCGGTDVQTAGGFGGSSPGGGAGGGAEAAGAAPGGGGGGGNGGCEIFSDGVGGAGARGQIEIAYDDPPVFTASASLLPAGAYISGTASFSPGTHTATGAVSSGPATASGSATFVGSYTASGSLTAGHATASGSATFSPGTHTASGAVSAGPATLSGTASFSPGTHTASGAVSSGPATLSGSATFVSGGKTATGALSSGPATASGSATFSPGTHTASAALQTREAQLASSATFASGTFTASGAVSAGPTTLIGSATFATYSFTASGAVSAGPATASAGATFSAGTHTATGSLSAAHATLSGSATFASGTFTASGTLSVAAATLAGTANFTGVSGTYTGVASLVVAPALIRVVLASDSFGTDTSANYTAVTGSFTISGGTLHSTSSTLLVINNTSGTHGIGVVSVEVKASAPGATVSAIGSYQDSNNYLHADLTINGVASTIKLYKKVAGVDTQIGSTYTLTTTILSTYTIALKWDGSSAASSWKISSADSDIAAASGAFTGSSNQGGFGASGNTGTVTFDNFSFADPGQASYVAPAATGGGNFPGCFPCCQGGCEIFKDNFSIDTSSAYSTSSGSFSISGGVLTSTSSLLFTFHTTSGTTPHGYVQVETSQSGSGTVRLVGSYVDSGNYCYLEYSPLSGIFSLNKIASGISTQLASGTSTSAGTDRLKLCWNGLFVVGVINDTDVLTAQFTGTGRKVGLGASLSSGTVTFDNFEFYKHAVDIGSCPSCYGETGSYPPIYPYPGSNWGSCFACQEAIPGDTTSRLLPMSLVSTVAGIRDMSVPSRIGGGCYCSYINQSTILSYQFDVPRWYSNSPDLFGSSFYGYFPTNIIHNDATMMEIPCGLWAGAALHHLQYLNPNTGAFDYLSCPLPGWITPVNYSNPNFTTGNSFWLALMYSDTDFLGAYAVGTAQYSLPCLGCGDSGNPNFVGGSYYFKRLILEAADYVAADGVACLTDLVGDMDVINTGFDAPHPDNPNGPPVGCIGTSHLDDPLTGITMSIS